MISYCENCEQTKKDLNETKQKLVEFQNLAKKIVHTDLILRKYSDKEKECEKLYDDLRKKDSNFDHLNSEYKNLLKEIDALKKQSKEYTKEKAQFEQILKEKNELIASFGQKESDYEQKLNSYVQNERLLENKSNNYQKQIADLRNELKILNEKYDRTVQKLNLESVKEAPSFTSNNLRTSTQILNVNFNEPIASEQVKEDLPKRETTFYLGSESENDETETKSVLKKDISLSQDEPKSLSFSLTKESRQIRFSETEEESNGQALTKKKKESSSSLDFSSSESESESSSSSSSNSAPASVVSEKSRSVFSTKDLFGSELSEEESDTQENKSIDVTNIQEEFGKKQQKDTEEKEKFEHKLNVSVDKCTANVIQLYIDDLVEESIVEELVLPDILDEIFDQEINSKNSGISRLLKSICSTCIDEEKIERSRINKEICDEIRKELEEEIYESIFDEKFNQLINECCQRVLIETKNEKIEAICALLVDQVCKENIEKCIIELLFDDMTCVPNPLIEKLEHKSKKELEFRPSKRRFSIDFLSPQEKEKRSRRESGDSESSWKSSLFVGEGIDKKALEEFVKECLADYFRKFNFKIEFTFEELDVLIDRLARAVKKKSSESSNSKFVAHILIKHYLNNKFIPLDDVKLNQVDENELKLFKQINMIYNTPVKEEFESITRTVYGNRSNQSSYTNYLQSKLNDSMMAKITNEEEKYVYILKKLVEYPTLELVQLEFLNTLRVLILGNEFQNTFKMKMGRMMCFVCKSRKNYDYLKSFVCDLIKLREISMPVHFQNLILWFARIWPECLTWPCSIDQINDDDVESTELHNPILFVLMNIVKNSIFKNNIELEKTKSDIKFSKFSKYYVYILESLCNWNIECFKSENSLSFLKASIKKAFESSHFFNLDENRFCLNRLMLEYYEAFKILCLNEDWTWTKQNFIENFIAKEMDEIDNKLTNKTLENDDELSLTNKYGFWCLSLCSIISLMCPDENFALEIFSKIKNKITVLEIVYINYELALIESVILLCRFDPNQCLNLVKIWSENFKARCQQQNLNFQLPENLKSEIKMVQSLYKEKIDTIENISFN